MQALDIADWRINNSTIDPGEPGVSNPDTPSLFVDTFEPADVNVHSSILVDPLQGADSFGGEGTVTCDFTDLPAVELTPGWDNQCPIGGGSTNTSTPPADLFAASNPYDWRLLPDSPAIDTGAPGPPPAGFAQKDLAGNPRRAAARRPVRTGLGTRVRTSSSARPASSSRPRS